MPTNSFEHLGQEVVEGKYWPLQHDVEQNIKRVKPSKPGIHF
jgi:hypothetical protein